MDKVQQDSGVSASVENATTQLNILNDKKFLDENYDSLNKRASKLYEFVLLYHEYIYAQHDYGSGQSFTMMEIHTLTFIQDNPGITITELSKMWGKSKSAVSQTVKKLVENGYVKKCNKENDSKTILLFTTENGEYLSYAHKAYDLADIAQTMGCLLLKCSEDEIQAFYKVLDAYTSLIKG